MIARCDQEGDNKETKKGAVRPRGLEPLTFAAAVRRSNPLSYGRRRIQFALRQMKFDRVSLGETRDESERIRVMRCVLRGNESYLMKRKMTLSCLVVWLLISDRLLTRASGHTSIGDPWRRDGDSNPEALAGLPLFESGSLPIRSSLQRQC